jgi:hypothetical protein
MERRVSLLSALVLAACTQPAPPVGSGGAPAPMVEQQPEVIAIIPTTATRLALDDFDVYLLLERTASNEFWRVPKGGGLLTFVAGIPGPPTNEVYLPGPFVVDSSKIYAAVNTVPAFVGGLIFSGPKNLGPPDLTQLAQIDQPITLQVDAHALYVGESSGIKGGGALFSLDKNTGAELHLYIAGVSLGIPPELRYQFPFLLTEDSTSLYSWVSSFGIAPNVLWKFAKDGSSSVVLAQTDAATPNGGIGGLNVDAKRVWTASSAGTWTVPKNSGPLVQWSTFGPVIRDAVGDDDYVYVIFADDTDAETTPARGVARISKDTGNADVISYLDEPVHLAIDASYLYWIRAGGQLVRWSLR